MTMSHPDFTNIKTGWEPRLSAKLSQLPPIVVGVIAIIAGALGVTSFAPFHFWPGYFIQLNRLQPSDVNQYLVKSRFLARQRCRIRLLWRRRLLGLR